MKNTKTLQVAMLVLITTLAPNLFAGGTSGGGALELRPLFRCGKIIVSYSPHQVVTSSQYEQGVDIANATIWIGFRMAQVNYNTEGAQFTVVQDDNTLITVTTNGGGSPVAQARVGNSDPIACEVTVIDRKQK